MIINSRPLSSHHHMNNDDATTSSSLTLSLPSSSSLPRPAPFEYTPLTPPTHPINPQALNLFPITQQQQQQQNSYNPIHDFYDYHQEQQIQLSLWPHNIPTNIHQPILPPSPPPPPVKHEQPPPFPWSTSKPATIHTLNHIVTVLNIRTISGTLVCKFCKSQQNDVQFDLVAKFQRLRTFIKRQIDNMLDRAPEHWKIPELGNCASCGKEKAMQPLIAGENENINWLFLLLGEMIGCCKLEQLRYFCKHSDIHRTGAKDRLIYYTYLGLCNQLQPNGPFRYYRLQNQ